MILRQFKIKDKKNKRKKNKGNKKEKKINNNNNQNNSKTNKNKFHPELTKKCKDKKLTLNNKKNSIIFPWTKEVNNSRANKESQSKAKKKKMNQKVKVKTEISNIFKVKFYNFFN